MLSNNKKIKKLFNLFSKEDNHKYNSHIANALDESFFYIEFTEAFLFEYEIKLILEKERSIFYNIKLEQALCDIHRLICHKDKNYTSHIATPKNINQMQNMIHDTLELIEGYKGSWCSKEKSDDDNLNNSIIGYYLNQQWKSNDFPQELIDKIFSADKYITLINKNSELMIVMEHDGKQSLFYSLNDQ